MAVSALDLFSLLLPWSLTGSNDIEMMKKKTWSLLCLSGLAGAAAFLCALVIFVDPFQIYRLATRYIPPIDNTTQVYSNAGIVRNYAYDSAIVGTSVTENFPSLADGRAARRPLYQAVHIRRHGV